MQTARCFEVYSADGTLIFRAYFIERAIPGTERKPEQGAQGSIAPNQGGKGDGEGDPMTSAQRRLLFRLMATQGIEGEKAHEELKRLFRVESLNEVLKFDASRMIDHLQKGKGGNSRGPSLQ